MSRFLRGRSRWEWPNKEKHRGRNDERGSSSLPRIPLCSTVRPAGPPARRRNKNKTFDISDNNQYLSRESRGDLVRVRLYESLARVWGLVWGLPSRRGRRSARTHNEIKHKGCAARSGTLMNVRGWDEMHTTSQHSKQELAQLVKAKRIPVFVSVVCRHAEGAREAGYDSAETDDDS